MKGVTVECRKDSGDWIEMDLSSLRFATSEDVDRFIRDNKHFDAYHHIFGREYRKLVDGKVAG